MTGVQTCALPICQLAYSEADGKLYRNGKHGTSAWDNYWTRASVDAIDVTSDGSVVISADKITTGTLNAANVSVTNLNASNITSGTIDASVIGVTNLNASNITSGTINASVIGVTNLDADEITTGTLSATRISGGTLDAADITVTNLSASAIAGGTLSGIILDVTGAATFRNKTTTGSRSISTITSGATTTATVTTTTSHGFSTGNVILITGASGTNSGDVNGGYYAIVVTGSSTFTITKTGTNSLNLTGGTASGSTSPAIVTSGSVTQGDIAAANDAILHLGATSASSANVGGTFTPRLQLESTYANFRDSIVRAKQIDVHESDADANSGTRRATIRGSATAAGRLVVENTAGAGDVTLYVDGNITTVNGGDLDVAGWASFGNWVAGAVSITPTANTPTSGAITYTALTGTGSIYGVVTPITTVIGSVVLGASFGGAPGSSSATIYVYRTNTTSTSIHYHIWRNPA